MKPQRPTDLSVIIVSYNTRHLLRRCLDSLQHDVAHSGLAGEFIVVDNCSSDGSPLMVRSDYPSVLLLEMGTNTGYAAAANAGLAVSQGRFLLLLNSDTEIRSGALRKMVEFLERNAQAGAVGPRLVNPDGSLQPSCFRFPTLAMTFLDFFPINYRLTRSRLNGRYPESSHSRPFSIDHPLGACLMVRHEVLESAGLLDERFFMYCEEVDWCYRIKQAGWRIFCVPDAEVMHYGGESAKQNRGAMFFELHRSRYMFFQKHYSHFFCLLAALITRAGTAWQSHLVERAFRRGEISPEVRDDLRAAYDRARKLAVGGV